MREFSAFLDKINSITILRPYSADHPPVSFSIMNEGRKTALEIKEVQQIENYQKYICFLPIEVSFGVTYWIVDSNGGKTDLQIGAVIRTDEFDHAFFYSGNDLGATVVNGQTHFKVWAPTATQVKLKLRSPNESYAEIIKMRREEKGVWTVKISRDLELFHYSFLVCVNLEWREAVDPYATAVTVNGELGVVVKLEKTRIPKPDLPRFEHPVDAIIYETHLRDFTIHPHSGVRHKGLYLGAGEINTRGKQNQLTGLSYVKDLGVTHIEFLPFNDFYGVDERGRGQEYNWGYNPLHFNVPDGSYATEPANPYSRILELKQLIQQLHDLGLRVIMDVVYNHVYIREQSSFEQIVPGYYFRHDEFGHPSNGTGVGNDLASERLMVRKFIVDSVRFWISEYHIDGFRFDLMGILDVETMNEVRTMADSLAEDILILGEGWNLNTPLKTEEKATILNQSKLLLIAQFNDRFRDCIKGSTFHLYEKGYALGNEHYYEEAKEVISGSIGFAQEGSPMFMEPHQTVNYVECHDNHTLWDKLNACFENEGEPVKRKFHRLATCLVLLSQGIPFLHSGQEFFRTKYGVGNSYHSPDDINQVDWDRAAAFSENIAYIKGVIEIRKSFPCFRLRSAAEIKNKITLLPLPPPLIGFFYHDFPEPLLLLVNPTLASRQIPLPDGDWIVIADEKSAGIIPLRQISQQKAGLAPISLIVLIKKR
ncbi:type I pullulanase [Bacillota bacterium Lsc_1132]